MRIAIPTFGREEIKTLNLLTDFEKREIYVYVNNYETEEELEKEKERLKKKYPNVYVIGAMTKGIPAIRNFILNDLLDKKIIMMDDDIEEILKLENDPKTLKGKLVPLKNDEIRMFFIKAFNICETNKTNLWGIYPIENPFYMSQKINPKGFCIGTMFGVINSDIMFDENLKLKEDYDFTIKHIIRHKKVARFDYMTVKAGHYTNDGGCVSQRKANPELEKECCDYILSKYPNILKRNPKRENEILIAL